MLRPNPAMNPATGKIHSPRNDRRSPQVDPHPRPANSKRASKRDVLPCRQQDLLITFQRPFATSHTMFSNGKIATVDLNGPPLVHWPQPQRRAPTVGDKQVIPRADTQWSAIDHVP